jgi:hypothetical protein
MTTAEREKMGAAVSASVHHLPAFASLTQVREAESRLARHREALRACAARHPGRRDVLVLHELAVERAERRFAAVVASYRHGLDARRESSDKSDKSS